MVGPPGRVPLPEYWALKTRYPVGLIGCGGRGRLVMRGLLQAPDTDLAAVCDVYDPNAERASRDLAGGRAKTLKDFRRLLEMKEVDAVMVSTPDHWHSIATVLGLEAGKHVYVEKPFALTIREGRAMVEAARRTGRILYPGTQHRSAPHIAEAAHIVSSGEIGDVAFVRVWNSGNIAPDIQKKVPDFGSAAGARLGLLPGPFAASAFQPDALPDQLPRSPIMPAATSPTTAITASIASIRSWARPRRIRFGCGTPLVSRECGRYLRPAYRNLSISRLHPGIRCVVGK